MTLDFKEHHLALETKAASESQLWATCPPLTPRWERAQRPHFSADQTAGTVAAVEEPQIHAPVGLALHLKVLMLTSCSEQKAARGKGR